MQSSKYLDLAATYGKKGKAWMIRKALVEGVSLCYAGILGDDIREQYLRLLRDEFSANSSKREVHLRRLFFHTDRQEEESDCLEGVLRDYHPKHGKWVHKKISEKQIDMLTTEGVIVISDAQTPDAILDELVENTTRRQVVIADADFVDPQIDYKRLNQRQVILLNGARVIREFAKDKFDVQSHFPGITNDIFDLL